MKKNWVDVREGSCYFNTSMLHVLFPPTPFLINEQYGEGEMSRVVVFVYVSAFNFALTISPLEFC